jgi:3-phenylpropionate/trans-cinnamate dioxygenase ferredoxin reductase component
MADPGFTGPIVIVGAGLAGGKAAVTLREEGYRGRLLLIGDEPGLPFGRPPLSKTYLRGEEDLSGWMVKDDRWYGEHDVEVIHDTAVQVDLQTRNVALRSGEAVGYQRLLLATGGRNRRLEVPGAKLPGIFQLRTVADCDALKAAATPGSHAVLVGMGFIGCEVAASLRQLGVRVTAILPGRLPLAGVLGEPVAEAIAAIHREAGVELIAGDEATGFEGADRIRRVITKKGNRLECDLVVVAVGIEPNSELVAGTSVETDNGVLVDGRCRTSDQAVFAAGDVANQAHPLFGRIRVEHYNNAEKQGAAAARAMLGAATPYDVVHSFWSDQYQHKLEYVGHSKRWDRFVVRGSLEERRFLGFYLEGGRLVAAVGLDRGGDPEVDKDGELALVSRLIAQRSSPSEAGLRNGALEKL